MLKMIKEAQANEALTPKMKRAMNVARTVLKNSDHAELTKSVTSVFESYGTAISPDEICRQVCKVYAKQFGINEHTMTNTEFRRLATQVRIELEDNKDEIYSDSQWKRLADAAWQQHQQKQSFYAQSEENEERGYRNSVAGPQDEFAITPRQICDQVVSIANSNGTPLDGAGFFSTAEQFRNELVDHYDETYSDEDWNSLVQDAWGEYKQTQGSEENEEQGWPSDYGDDHDDDEVSSEELDDWRDKIASMTPEEREQLERELNEPWDKHDDERRHEDDDDSHFEDEEVHSIVNRVLGGTDGQPLTSEQEGWRDGNVSEFPKRPTDTSYMDGFNRARALNKVPKRRGTENEESAQQRSRSVLKDLMSQKKSVAQKASEAQKRIESEGARKFHTVRMQYEQSPYDADSQPEEYAAWTRGWRKAATEFYTPVEKDTGKRKKRKSTNK